MSIDKNILKNLDKIPNINQGGCGTVAVGLKRKYKKGTLLKLIAGFFTEATHIALRIGNKVVDTKGVKIEADLNGYNRIEEITEKELIKTIKDKKLWAKDFSRNDIDKIEEILKINLSDLK